ncbi:MAG: hypothetical protein MJ127_01035 [Mogibacterium sp.]|nr:hypothetical protein [Mogibacterium sp.]
MTTNQILVICLLVVLVGFVAVLGNMGVYAVQLLKKVKELVVAGKDFMGGAKDTVSKVGDSITSSANNLVASADTTTKVFGAAGAGIVGFSLLSAIFRKLFKRKSRKTAKAIKRSEKELKAAKKASKKAKKIQKKAKKLAKAGK